MFKKIITIVLPIIAVTAAIFIIGLKVYQDSFDKFQYDGYVIGTSNGKESAKYHFSKDEKYKVNDTNAKVEFTSSEEKDVTVPDASFVHYTDGSISTFKKAVVLNVENVKTDSLQYYNIFKGSVFTKTNNGYKIKYLEKELMFKNFIVKISDTKYMIVGENLEIAYGEKKETIKDGFLEINYLDGNIIRVENQDFFLQNISSDFNIKVEGVDLDLLNKKIIYEEETKVNFGEITIDSDDNIEIIPDDENTQIDTEEMNKIEDIENAPVVTPGSNVDGMESGIVDTTIEKADEIIQENEKIPDAVLKTVLFNVTPSSMVATVSVDDPANTLKGDVTWKIVENATNSIICQNRSAHGRKSVEVECSGLAPETNYSLIVSSKYEKNEVTYEKDFLQRTFITMSAGVSIEKDYVSTDMIAFKVQIPETSSLSSFTYNVIESANPSNVLETGYFVRSHSSTSSCDNKMASVNGMIPQVDECHVLIDTNIKSNTKYSLVIKEIVHGTLEMPENFEIYKTVASLKQKPSFGGTNIVTNKMSSKFSLSLNTVTDPNNSILSYRADIYPLNTQDDDSTIVATREASIANQIDINVDGETIVRGNNYVAKIYVTYYDNEKEYDVLVGTSPVMNMTSVEAPTARFEMRDVLHDSIKGDIIVTDSANAIVEGSIKISVQNLSEATADELIANYEESTIDRVTTKFTIERDGLQANSDYRFVVQAQVILEQNLNEPVYVKIGEFIVKTPNPAVQRTWIENVTGIEKNYYFAIRFLMTPDNCGTEGEGYIPCYEKQQDAEGNDIIVQNPDVTPARLARAWHEIKTIQNMSFRLRKSDDDYIDTREECEEAQYCWTFDYSDNRDAYDESTFIEMFYPSAYATNPGTSTPTFRPLGENNDRDLLALNLNLGDATEEGGGLPKDRYVLEVLSATDYTKYDNDIDVTTTSVEFMSNAEGAKDVTTFTEKLVKNEAGEPDSYNITTSQIIAEFIDIKDQYSEYTSEEEFEHYMVNLNTGAVCLIGEKKYDYDDTDATDRQNARFLNSNGKNVSFKISEYNAAQPDECDIVRGQSYGYFYNYRLRVNYNGETKEFKHGSEAIFRPFKDEHQPLTEVPKVETVLSKTIGTGDTLKYVFKYDINDPTRSFGDNPQIEYKGENDADWSNVYCGADYDETENCISTPANGKINGTVAVGRFNGNKLSLRANYTLLAGAEGTIGLNDIGGTLKEYEYEVKAQAYSKVLVNEMVIEPERIFDNNSHVFWTVTPSKKVQNAVTFKFPKTDLNGNAMNIQYSYFTKYFVGAKLTLYRNCNGAAGCDSTPIVLYRKFDENGYQNQNIDGPSPEITVTYGEIADLMSRDYLIKTDVELLYDMNHYGFDTENTDMVALQSFRTAYGFESLSSVSGIFRKTKITCDLENPKCTLTYRSADYSDQKYEATEDDKFVLTKENGALYYEPASGQKKYLQAKKLNTLAGECAASTNQCLFRFTSITPTLYMDDKDVKSTYGGVNYTMRFAISDELKGPDEGLKIRIRYYADEGMSIPIKHKGTNYVREITYEDLEENYLQADGETYIITESELLQKTTYYARIMWVINGLEEDDFYYDPTWHLQHIGNDETRLYKFTTKDTLSYNPYSQAYYQRGSHKKYQTNGVANPSYNVTAGSGYAYQIDPDIARVLSINSYITQEVNALLDCAIVTVKIDSDEDGEGDLVWDEFNVDKTSFGVSSGRHLITTKVDLAPKTINGNTYHFKAATKFTVEVTPYEYCNPDLDPGNIYNKCETTGIRHFTTFRNSLTYNISKPSVSIIRDNVKNSAYANTADIFNFKITISDTYRAVGRYNYAKDAEGNYIYTEASKPAVYQLKIIADGEEVEGAGATIISHNPTLTYQGDVDVTACRGATTCRLELHYKIDVNNAGTAEVDTVEIKDINVKYNYDAGEISRGSVSSNEIEIFFKNGFNVQDNIKKYDVVISHDTYADIIYNDKTPIFSERNRVKYTTIDIVSPDKLKPDELYSVTVQFKTSDGLLLDEWSAEGITYSSK